MKKIKVCFADFWPEFINDENIFLPILQKYFEVEITKNNPDLVIHSIFGGMKETPNYKCKKILFLGENYRPKHYGSNYSISFDPTDNTNFRLPLWQYFLILKPELQTILFEPRINNESFDKFCAFIVSNPNNFLRNAFYNQLSLQSFGKVHSYGRYLTNDIGLQQASKNKYWRDAKYDFFKLNKHKYSICFEHSSYPYYCTEKLMDAFLGLSIPVYWGDPKINEDWNKEAFINVGKLGTDETIKLIRQLETNTEMFNKIYTQPIFTNEQKLKHIKNIENFELWLISKINEL